MEEKLLQILQNAKCPESFSNEQGPGVGEILEFDLHFYPGDSNIDKLNENGEKLCSIHVRSHGLWIFLESTTMGLCNDQIVLFDTYKYEEDIIYKKDTASYMKAGALIADGGIPGAIIGATIGGLLSIGKTKKHIKGSYIRLVYWDKEDRQLKYIVFTHTGDPVCAESLIKSWNEQKKINEETGRKPEEVKSPGCFGMITIAIVIASSIALLL